MIEFGILERDSESVYWVSPNNKSEEQIPMSLKEFREFPWKSLYLQGLTTSSNEYESLLLEEIYSAYSKYPKGRLKEFTNRLTNYTNYSRPALFELYIYSLIAKQGIHIDVEKEKENRKSIDFSLNNLNEINIEVTTIGKKKADLGNDSMLSNFFLSLEKSLSFPKYHLYFEVKERTEIPPNLEVVLKTLNEKLRNLPTDLKVSEFEELVTIHLNDSGWCFKVSWQLNRITQIDAKFTPIFFSTLPAKMDISDSLKQAVMQKLPKFDGLTESKNYIAIGNDLDFLEITNFQIFNFFYGQAKVQINLASGEATNICDGLGFYYTTSTDLRNLTGLIFQNTGLLGFGANNLPLLWLNPSAHQIWNKTDLPFSHNTVFEKNGEFSLIDPNGSIINQNIFSV
jgi:hypothetical protein